MAESTRSYSRRAVVGAFAVAPLLMTSIGRAASATPLSRLCVQGRPQDTGSVYKYANIMSALNQLGGVRLMRCRDPYTGTAGWNTYIALARAGVRFIFTLSTRDPQRTLSDLRAFLTAVPGSVLAIEGPNEPDLNPVTFNGQTDPRLGFRTGNAPALMNYITTMRNLFATDSLLSAIPIIASNDYMQAQQASLSTYGNSHIYPRETTNVPQLVTNFCNLVTTGNHQQGIITEWGRTTGGNSANATAAPVTLQRQAELLASDLRSAFAAPKVAVISLYELFSWGGTSEQNNFGLFNFDLTPRPVVAAIRAVVS